MTARAERSSSSSRAAALKPRGGAAKGAPPPLPAPPAEAPDEQQRLLAAAAAAAELFGDEAAYAKWKERYPESGFDEKAHDGAPLAEGDLVLFTQPHYAFDGYDEEDGRRHNHVEGYRRVAGQLQRLPPRRRRYRGFVTVRVIWAERTPFMRGRLRRQGATQEAMPAPLEALRVKQHNMRDVWRWNGAHPRGPAQARDKLWPPEEFV